MKVLKAYSTTLSLGLVLAVLSPRFMSVCGDVLPTCPRHCECTNARSRSTRLPELSLGSLLKLKCGGGDKSLSSLQELDLSSVTDDITQLDLSDNQISVIEKGAFSKLTQLKRLDLSHNQLSTVGAIFDGLEKLERLKLNHNQMTYLKEGVFDPLTSLKQLDISGNPWYCDCELTWLLDWAHDRSVKLTPAAKCDLPAARSGQPLRKLRTDADSDCVDALTLRPLRDQVVFEGDSLTLQCRAPGRDALTWTWEDRPVADAFADVDVADADTPGVKESRLVVGALTGEHTGLWRCRQEHRNWSLAIAVIVISEKTVYCPQEATSDSRGSYTWPKTVMGVTAETPCEGEQQTSGRKAYHTCARDGRWISLDTSACPYVSETTKVLEQFAKMDLALTKGAATIVESARRLKNFTGDGRRLADKMDVLFVAKTVENYLGYVREEKELGAILVDVVASVLGTPAGVMRAAQAEGDACARLARAVEYVAENAPALRTHGAALAAEEFRVRREAFPGLTCSWYESGPLRCSDGNETAAARPGAVRASVRVPASLFYQLEAQGVQGTALARRLTVVAYARAELFPAAPGEEVTSAVVGVNLVGIPAAGLADPVYVVLRSPPGSGGPPRPVWWDTRTGGWSSQGCQLSYLVDELLVFQCNRLGYFGLVRKTEDSLDISGSVTGAKFRFSHPAIYVGCLVCVATLTASVSAFVSCHATIRMSQRSKHSLVNTWLAVDLLTLAFAVGIHQTEDARVCRCFGLALHYLSLSALLWMGVAVGSVQERAAKTVVDEDGEEPRPKPLLGLYLVGWGVGLIVCGISGAVNLRRYAGKQCFLVPGPAVSAVFVPGALLVLYVCVRLLLVRCALRDSDTNRQLSEATENVDLELLDAGVAVQTGTRVSPTPTGSSEVEDPECSGTARLRAHAICLVLFVCAWGAGALATSTPFRFPHEEAAFSVLFALFASALGCFVLFFHCVARSDVGGPRRCCRTRSISDTNPVSGRLSAEASVSRLTDRSVKSTEAARAATELNRRATKTEPDTGGVNLVVMHRRQYRSDNSVVTTFTEPSGPSGAEMFYDPRQSTVARKFFRKQRRHTRRNGLGARPRGDGGGGDTDVEAPRPPPASDTTLEGEAVLAELAAEFRAIKEEISETRAKEAAAELDRATPVEKCDDRNSAEMCGLLTDEDSRRIDVDGDVSLSRQYSTDSSRFTPSALERNGEERECLTEPSSFDDLIDNEQADVLNKKETSV